MNKSAALHRHLYLIRQLQPPYSYPGKALLVARLKSMGFPAVSNRTLERDFSAITHEYGLPVAFHHTQRGYYLSLPTDEDVSDFHQFLRLLERRERLEFLTHSIGGAHEVSRFLQLESNEHFTGLDLLPRLWEALRAGRVVRFTYRSYAGTPPRLRTVEPGLIFEDRNRWYLAGWDQDIDKLRTFGLDRISDLASTDRLVTDDRADEYRNHRQHVIGVTAPPDQPVERVVLRFTPLEGNYVISLPMHGSQRVLRNDGHGVEIELRVIPNFELEREILGYGEEVEVLEPLALREKIAARLRKMGERYS
jgi:predicted DNA-binding transcriptional regulator YafY